MSTSLATIDTSMTVWGTIEKMAPVMQKARLFGVATVEQAMAIMAKGHELGLPLTSSFQFIHIISDKPSLSPQGALALIYKSPEFDGIKIEDLKDEKGNPTACNVWMKRKNGIEYTASFSMADAQRAGLIKGTEGGWTKYPSNMLRWRAVGYCADVVFPDVTGGMKRADEFGADITPDGQVIVVDAKSSAPRVDTGKLLNQLVEDFGAMAILEANQNKLPATASEIQALRIQLENTVTVTAAAA